MTNEQYKSILKRSMPAYSFVERIGIGCFGSVLKCERDGIYYAIKIISIPASDDELQMLLSRYKPDDVKELLLEKVRSYQREIKLMSELKGNRNIVNIEDYQIIEAEDRLGYYIVIRMELLTSLVRYTASHSLSREEIIQLGIDICDALAICEKHKIIHRDIKPENILIHSDGAYKLGDFGVAKQILKTSSGTIAGTEGFMAPEVNKGREYGHTADIYSLGILLYYYLNNQKMPFVDPENRSIVAEQEAIVKRLNFKDVLPFPPNCDENLAKVVVKACMYDSSCRYRSAIDMRRDLMTVLSGGQVDVNLTPNAEHGTIVHANYNVLRNEKIATPFVGDVVDNTFEERRIKQEKTTEKFDSIDTTEQKKVTNNSNVKKRLSGISIVCIILCTLLLTFSIVFFVKGKTNNSSNTPTVETGPISNVAVLGAGVPIQRSSRIAESPSEFFSYSFDYVFYADLPAYAENITWDVINVTPNVMTSINVETAPDTLEFSLFQYASTRTDMDYGVADGTVEAYECLVTLTYDVNNVSYYSEHQVREELPKSGVLIYEPFDSVPYLSDEGFSYIVDFLCFADLPANAENVIWDVINITPNVLMYSGETDYDAISFSLLQYASTKTDMDYGVADGTVEAYECLVTLTYDVNGISYYSEYQIREELPKTEASIDDSQNIDETVNVYLKSISIYTLPNKTKYYVDLDNALDLFGLTLTATYSDGSTEIITSGFNCSSVSLNEVGNKTVMVTYGGVNTQFEVYVVGIAYLSLNSDVEVFVGEMLPDFEIPIEVTYTDGFSRVITSGYEWSEFDNNNVLEDEYFCEAGMNTTTISYCGISSEIDIMAYSTKDNHELFRNPMISNSYYAFMNESYTNHVGWCLTFQFTWSPDYDDDINLICSWEDNITRLSEDTDIFECEPTNYTRWTTGTVSSSSLYYIDEYQYFTVELLLPDDPSMAGEQSVTITVGDESRTFYFTLVYNGDYKTGAGWSIGAYWMDSDY